MGKRDLNFRDPNRYEMALFFKSLNKSQLVFKQQSGNNTGPLILIRLNIFTIKNVR
jgi:hypothetical protein